MNLVSPKFSFDLSWVCPCFFPFCGILYAGHYLYICMLVALLETPLFLELVRVRYSAHYATIQDKIPLFQTTQWMWFTLAIFLPSRDPYPLPDWVTFGQFLAASLTFTKSLDTISVFVNDEAKLCIHKKWCMHHGSWWPHRIIAGNNNSNTILLREP
jgi:hypothetical protein